MHGEARHVTARRTSTAQTCARTLALLASLSVPPVAALDLTGDRAAATVDATVVGSHESHRIGSALATGDWNGDGIDDLAIAGPSSQASMPPHPGSVAIFFGGSRLPPLTDLAAEAPDVLLVGAQAGTQFGWRLQSLDLNGDGIDDLAVGANGFVRTGTGAAVAVGAVSIFLGKPAWPAGWDTSVVPEDMRIIGTLRNESFGHNFAAGDFNGDGVEDLAAQSVGPDDLDPRFQAGIVRLFFGRALLPATWDLRVTRADVTITGAGRGDLLGGTFGLDAGDLDGDGIADLAAGAYREDTGSCPDCGVVHVFRGRPSWPATIDLATDVSDMVVLGTERNCFGCGIAVGDVNGDGAADLLMGGDSLHAYFGPFAFPRTIALASEPPDRSIRPAPGEDIGRWLRVRDVDDDGVGDLLTFRSGERALLLSGATWTQPVIDLTTDAACCQVVEIPGPQFALDVGDWDANGSADVAFGTLHGSHSALFTPGDARIFYGCRDAEPPRFDAVTLDGACLWPPMHGYVCTDLASAGITVSDDCSKSSEIRVRIVDVISDQPDDAGGRRGPRGGDGHTTQDFVLSADGTRACLRSERIGDRTEGRTYTLILEATDAFGRTSLRSVEVHVPRDQREHPDCLRATPSRGLLRGR